MSVSTTTSRRSFLKGAGAGVAASALGIASAAIADEAAGGPNAAPEAWDVETDVVVMGYGYAGQASAISAAVEGSKVQVFEKAPEEYAGGNSSACFNQEKPNLEKANYPFWMVFDETRRTAGTIFGWSNTKANEGWMSVHGPVQWSDDCAPEIEDGYVLKADSIEELGGLMGYEGDDLSAFVDEINAFNENGANGEDPEFGRSLSKDEQKNGTLGITDGPFYAIKCGLCYLNTNGGGARNTDYQLVDWNDQPVARLYGAGEFGSIFYLYYSGGGNICECFTSGMKCGQNVSALEPWA